MVLVCGCAYVPEPPPVGDHPPVLDGWYASPTATWGQTWKIYIKAHDVDGDLWEARFNIDQLGVTYSDADAYTILTKEYWNGIDGYFFLQIPDRSMSFGPINLVMSVVLMDRGGRKSQEIQIPLKVGLQPQQPPPGGFADRPIGPIRQVLRSN